MRRRVPKPPRPVVLHFGGIDLPDSDVADALVHMSLSVARRAGLRVRRAPAAMRSALAEGMRDLADEIEREVT